MSTYEVVSDSPAIRGMRVAVAKGRTVQIEVTESKHYTNEKSGGSWETFRAVRCQSLAEGLVAFSSCAVPEVAHEGARGPFASLIHGRIQLTPELILIVHSMFCGKDLGERVFIHPDSPLVAALEATKAAPTKCTHDHEDCLAHPELAAACAAKTAERDRGILAVFKSIKGGHRTEYLTRWRFTDVDRDRFMRAGWIKVNKAGAVQITPEGRIFAGNADYTPRDFFAVESVS